MDKIVGKMSLAFFLTVFAVDGHAQWPLGKESPQLPGKSSETLVSVTGSGRHQVFVSPNIKGHTFMIDTDTGKIWIFRKDSATGDFSLQRVPVEQEIGQVVEPGRKTGSGATSSKGN